MISLFLYTFLISSCDIMKWKRMRRVTMKGLSKFYFSVFPIVFIPLMYLVYDGNVFLYNLFTVVILFILVINGLIIRSERDRDVSIIASENLSRIKGIHLTSTVLFIGMYLFLFFKFVAEEVLPGLGSV